MMLALIMLAVIAGLLCTAGLLRALLFRAPPSPGFKQVARTPLLSPADMEAAHPSQRKDVRRELAWGDEGADRTPPAPGRGLLSRLYSASSDVGSALASIFWEPPSEPDTPPAASGGSELSYVPPPSLPSGARAFLGEWQQVDNSHYGEYLTEVIGLNWALRNIAGRIPLSPTFKIVDGELRCVMECIGAKPVRLPARTPIEPPHRLTRAPRRATSTQVTERMIDGEFDFYEANQDLNYRVRGKWEGTRFVATRRHASVNGGRQMVATKWIDDDGLLVMKQEWGGAHPCHTYCRRVERA